MAKTSFKLKELGKKQILVRLGRFDYAILWGGQGATKDAAEAIARKARELAPVLKQLQQVQTHPGLTRGALKNSIRVEKVGPMSYIIGSNLDYAYYVEIGADHPGFTAKKPIYFWSEKESRFRWIPAGYTVEAHRIKMQPFMRPAILWGEKQLFIKSAAYIARGIKKMCLAR